MLLFYDKLSLCMTTPSPSRAEETFKEIQAIEVEAQKILETAEKERLLHLHEAKKAAEDLIKNAAASARNETDKLIGEARRQAEVEKQQLEAATRTEVEALRKTTLPKIKKAQELCR